MIKTNSLAWLAGLLILPLVAGAAALPDFRELVAQNQSAVVNISTKTDPDDAGPGAGMPGMPDLPEDSPLREFFRHFFGEDGMGKGAPRVTPRSSLGSGFIISKDGYVISNEHVVRDADEVVVRLADRREFIATIVGTDNRSDIAVLKIDTDEDLPTVDLGDSSKLVAGEWVLAIGSPFGFEHSVTQGIVSAVKRSLPNENYVPFIQTDVAINPGNSGGPLFNLDGEVVGVNSQIFSRTGGFMGLSFAIPINVVLDVYDQLRESGSVKRGWLGVLIQDVDQQLAESFDMDRPRGALVSRVLPDSPAERAGFEVGDVVLSFDGVAIERSSDLPPLVGRTSIEESVPVAVLRDGARRTLRVTIGELPAEDELAGVGRGPRPPQDDGSYTDPRLGLTVSELDAEARKAKGIEDGGVLVTEAGDGSAFDAGIRKGDVIVQLDNQKVESLSQFEKLASQLEGGRAVAVLIQRRGGPLFMAMKVPAAGAD